MTVEASSSCSSAEGGRRILSPGRLLVTRDVGVTPYVEDQLTDTDSVAISMKLLCKIRNFGTKKISTAFALPGHNVVGRNYSR